MRVYHADGSVVEPGEMHQYEIDNLMISHALTALHEALDQASVDAYSITQMPEADPALVNDLERVGKYIEQAMIILEDRV